MDGDSSSSSSSAAPNVGPGTAKPNPPKKAGKAASKPADGKRRRVQSCPPTAPLVAPAHPVTSEGWSQTNIRLLEEWKNYLCAYVKQDPVLTEAEGQNILAEFTNSCQAAQDHMRVQQEVAEAFLQQTRTETAAGLDWSPLKHNKRKEADEKKTERSAPYKRP